MSKAKIYGILAVVTTVIVIALVVGTAVTKLVGPGYEFQDKVHSHMENAYWGSTPELMMIELHLAVDGMRELGLVEGMSGKMMPWKQTPDWSMDYQFAHVGAIIERCEEVIAWRDAQDLISGQVTDVYNEKMANLKSFIVEGGWSDDIAELAWYANHHQWYIFYGWIVGGVVACLAFAIGAKALICFDDDEYDEFFRAIVWIVGIILIVGVAALVAYQCLGA